MKPENHQKELSVLLILLLIVAAPFAEASHVAGHKASLWDNIKSAGKSIIDTTKKVVDAVKKAFTPAPAPPVQPKPTEPPKPQDKGFFGNIIDTGKNIVKKVGDFIGGIIKPVIDVFKPSGGGTGGAGQIEVPTYPIPNPLGTPYPGSSNPSGSFFTPGDENVQYDYLDPGDLRAIEVYTTRIGSGDALWYNVDVADLTLKCPSCPVIDGEKREIPGFIYVADIEFIVQGNHPSKKVVLSIKAESPNKEDFYEKKYTVSLPNGRYVFSEPLKLINITPETTNLIGGDSLFDYKVTAKVEDDVGVVFPQRVVFIKSENRCSWIGWTYRCNLVQTKTITDCCPGSDYCNTREYGSSQNITEAELGVGINLDNCKAYLVDDPSSDEKQKVFKLKKLSPDLAVRASLGIPFPIK